MGYPTTRIVLNKLAEEASKTKGASFAITFIKGNWKISFPNQWQRENDTNLSHVIFFEHESLLKAAKSATNWIIDVRKDIPPIIKEYTL